MDARFRMSATTSARYRQADGTLVPLPRKSIDTGAGLERLLSILQRRDSIWDIDVIRPVIAAAESVTGRRYGEDDDTDVALRILADHSRGVTFLVNDHVVPSNEDRGYVLRRIIRRAVRQAFQMDVERLVTPALVAAAIDVMAVSRTITIYRLILCSQESCCWPPPVLNVVRG